jgi:hypothetical protein
MTSPARGIQRTARSTALIAILALLIAACGGATTGRDVAAEPTDDSGQATDPADDSTDEELPQTLADFWGYGEDFDPAEEEARYREQEMKLQQSIAECMAAEGFEYTPYVHEESFEYYGPEQDLTEEERMLKYGYGYFTYMLEETAAFEEGAFEEEWDPSDDPNWVYQESLSESERQAYEIALWGNWENFEESGPTYDDEGNEIWEEPDWSEIGGCQNLAQEEIYGGFGPDPEMDALYEELWPKQEELYERIQADARIVEANEKWSACMADTGYTFTTQEDIWMYLDELGQDLWSEQEQYSIQIDEQAQALPEEEREAFYEESYADFGPWGGATEEEIQALAEEELAIAAADWGCRGDLTELMEEVTEEYESQFIAENIELLQQLKNMQEERGW